MAKGNQNLARSYRKHYEYHHLSYLQSHFSAIVLRELGASSLVRSEWVVKPNIEHVWPLLPREIKAKLTKEHFIRKLHNKESHLLPLNITAHARFIKRNLNVSQLDSAVAKLHNFSRLSLQARAIVADLFFRNFKPGIDYPYYNLPIFALENHAARIICTMDPDEWVSWSALLDFVSSEFDTSSKREFHFQLSQNIKLFSPSVYGGANGAAFVSVRQLLRIGRSYALKAKLGDEDLGFALKMFNDMEAGRLRFCVAKRANRSGNIEIIHASGIPTKIIFSTKTPRIFDGIARMSSDECTINLFENTTISITAIQDLIWEYCHNKKSHDIHLDIPLVANVHQLIVVADPNMDVWCPDLSGARFSDFVPREESNQSVTVTPQFPAHQWASVSSSDVLRKVTDDIMALANAVNWRNIQVVPLSPAVVKLSFARPDRTFGQMFVYNFCVSKLKMYIDTPHR